MKLFKYGLPFAALALLASCSNDNMEQPSGGENQVPAEGKMYTSIQIKLPAGPNTRDVTYSNGKASEYAANSGYLALYSAKGKSTEDAYVCIDVQPLSSLAWSPATEDAVNEITTTSTTATAVFKELEDLDDLYGLVILNSPNEGFLPEKQQTFGAWKTKEFQKGSTAFGTLDSEGKFTMTNAPEGAEGTTLVAITEDAFATSIAALGEADTPEFYVQRVVAKVSIASSVKEVFELEDGEGEKTGETVKFTNWALNYTNNYTFPVQVLGGVTGVTEDFEAWSQYGLSALTAGTDFNRVYWGIDPNYKGDDNAYTSAGEADNFSTSLSEVSQNLDYVAYPLENTMSYENMTQGQTTYAVLKGTFKLNGQTEGTSFITYGVLKVPVPTDIDPENKVSKAGIALGDLFTGEALNTMLGKLGLTSAEGITVDYYHKGECYYTIRIRHFEDGELSGWDFDTWKEGGYTYEEGHTGRFGILRNNWYEIAVKSVSGLGEPEIPTPDPEEPDDPKNDKYYINAQINILSWAKRSHEYDL